MAKNALTKQGGLSIPGMKLTPTGIIFNGKVTAANWAKAGEQLARYEGGLNWWIGDWLLYGEGKPEWGDKYEKAVELFGRELQALKDTKSVSKNVQLSLRNDNLSWNHHKAVSPLTPAKQKSWLKRYESKDWSARKLLPHRRSRSASCV